MRQLSQQRLSAITGATTASEQCSVLRQIGVAPIIRADGSVCVFEEVLRDAMLIRHKPDDQPNWGALDGAA